MKRALVFSGGGAKGSYQIGVWKALRRLNMKFDIVTGTSIGSINGALYVQQEYSKAKKLWLKMSTDDLFHESNIKDMAKEIAKNHGMKFDKAEKLLKKIIKENKIRKSNIDYGLVTVSLKNKTPKMLTTETIGKGKLVDYIIASSTCFPAVEKKEIDGEYYIDGGYYDNLPINLAIDMGAEEILAIDLSSIGIKQKVKDKSVKIDIIKNNNQHLFTLEFSKENTIKNINIGYNDTMKYFGYYDGDKYTFRKNSIKKISKKLEKIYLKFLNDLTEDAQKGKIKKEVFKISKYNKLLLELNSNKKIDDYVLETIEYIASVFEIDNSKIYTLSDLNKKILNIIKEKELIKLDKNIKGQMLITYMYKQYYNKKEKEIYNLALLFPKEYLATIYLIGITK